MGNTYNPYKTVIDQSAFDALQNIYNNKGNFHTAADIGQNPEQYRQAAVPSYDYLRKIGMGSVADELTNSNYTQAKSIIDRYKLPDSAADKANSFLNTNMSALKSFLPNTAKTQKNYQKSINSMYDDYTGKADSIYKDNKKAFDRYGGNLSSLFDQYMNRSMTVDNQSDQLWNDMRKFGTEQTARYDNLTDFIYKNDYTDTPWYETMMEGYKLKGDNAAGDAVANAGGNNSGNIDSYAAANANRQQLAFTNAGNQAALNAYNAQIGNVLSTIQSLGYDIGNLQNRQQSNIDSSRSANQGMLDSYNQGQYYLGDLMNQNSKNVLDAYGNAGNNFNAGYGNLMTAQNQESANTISALDSLLQHYTNMDANQKDYDLQLNSNTAVNDLEKYKVDSQERQNVINNYTEQLGYYLQHDLGYTQEETKKVIAEMEQSGLLESLAAQERMNSSDNATSRANAQTSASSSYSIAQMNNASDERIAQLNADSEMERLMINSYIDNVNSNPTVKAEHQDIYNKIDSLYKKGDSRYGNSPLSYDRVRGVLINDLGSEYALAIDVAIDQHMRSSGATSRKAVHDDKVKDTSVPKKTLS